MILGFLKDSFNPFLPSVPFLCSLKLSENQNVFRGHKKLKLGRNELNHERTKTFMLIAMTEFWEIQKGSKFRGGLKVCHTALPR